MWRQWTWCLLCLLVCPSVWGWSTNGHGDIAVVALEQLPKPTQEEYWQILAAGPWVKAKDKISWRAVASRAAAWPDRVRSQPVSKLFSQYGSGKVPAALNAYRDLSTNDWHYTNALFLAANGKLVKASPVGSGASCPPTSDGRLLETWPHLMAAYEQSGDARDKAIVLAFLLHMVADAYQPLHLMGSLNTNCRHDRGGNAFCVGPIVGFKAGLRCRDSLHFLWDQGFGVFATELSAPKRFRGNPRDLSAAVTAVKRIGSQVYPGKSEEPSSASYQQRSRRHTEEMAQKASGHLAATLKLLAH